MNPSRSKAPRLTGALTLLAVCGGAHAGDTLTLKNIGMELARDLANEAVMACRDAGYQVSAVVVDRNGIVRASLRDDLAARFTLQIAEEKANLVVMSGIASGQMRENRADIRPELNHVNGLLVMVGGLPIEAGGSRVGALGVSGAPGGERDEACAQAALDKLADRLAFAD